MTSVSVAVEPPSLAVMDTAFVDAGCAGKETRHAPSARACAEASATVSVSALTTETVTLAPGAAQPQTEAACEGGGGGGGVVGRLLYTKFPITAAEEGKCARCHQVVASRGARAEGPCCCRRRGKR